jgi:hypothetical protein
MAVTVTKAWLAAYMVLQPKHKVARMVGRALVALYNRQTLIERCGATTIEQNGKGFNAVDAEVGSSMAKQFLAGRSLTDKQVGVWARNGRILKYARQLNEIALEKARK